MVFKQPDNFIFAVCSIIGSQINYINNFSKKKNTLTQFYGKLYVVIKLDRIVTRSHKSITNELQRIHFSFLELFVIVNNT